MRYKLNKCFQFGATLAADGRTILDFPVKVLAGSEVERLADGEWGMVLVSYTDPQGKVCYGWVFLDELTPIEVV